MYAAIILAFFYAKFKNIYIYVNTIPLQLTRQAMYIQRKK